MDKYKIWTSCSKCWQRWATVKYSMNIPDEDTPFWRMWDDMPCIELMTRTCQTCWYIWHEAPLDVE
jgi:hypothetical protein